MSENELEEAFEEEDLDVSGGDGTPGGALFPGDASQLDPRQRLCLYQLKKRPFVTAEEYPEEWDTLLTYESLLRSRLNEDFLDLDLDRSNGVARKLAVRNEGILLPGRKNRGLPTLLRSRSMDRYETIVAVFLRLTLRLADLTGDQSAYLAYDDLEEFALALPAVEVPNRSEFRASLRKALLGPGSFGSHFIVKTDQEDRFRIRRAIAIVLDHDALATLLAELNRQIQARAEGARVSEINGSGPRVSVELELAANDQLSFDLDPDVDEESGAPGEIDLAGLGADDVSGPDGRQP